MKPKTKLYKISKEDLDRIELPDWSNIVIVHIPHKNEETKTESGIYVVSDQDFKPAIHAERWGYIFKKNDNLHYDNKSAASIPWKTKCEVEVGDKVWFDFREALYAYTFDCDGEWYKIINYEFLSLSVGGSKVIKPLNGYVLFSEYKKPKESELLLDSKVEEKYGVVEYVGEVNEEYTHPIWGDGIEVNKGDHVLFEEGSKCFSLESGLHNEFSDDKIILQQRRKVVAVVDSDHSHVLRLHDMVVGVNHVEGDNVIGHISLLGDPNSIRVGEVMESGTKNIPVGANVVLPKNKGTEFNGLEYFTEDRILFYETTA
jgi:co-chaperonin GroES (HSP10)